MGVQCCSLLLAGWTFKAGNQYIDLPKWESKFFDPCKASISANVAMSSVCLSCQWLSTGQVILSTWLFGTMPYRCFHWALIHDKSSHLVPTLICPSACLFPRPPCLWHFSFSPSRSLITYHFRPFLLLYKVDDQVHLLKLCLLGRFIFHTTSLI